MAADTSVINLLLDAIVTKLTLDLQTNISDSTQVKLIREGRLQADPTTAGSNILVYPATPDWKNELNKPEDTQWKAPVYEIGDPPTIFFRKRFVIEMAFFFVGEQDRSVARTKAWVMYSRTQWSLSSLPMGQKDTFGERAYKLALMDGYMDAEGGPGTFIWRGKLLVEFETDFAPL